MKPVPVFPLVLLILLSGCRINYDLAGGEDDESIPDIYMEGLRQIKTTGDGTAMELSADSASIFSEEGETLFENMEFRDNGKDGELLRIGSAGRARLYNENDADLTGGIEIESYVDEVRIEGEAFYWKDEKQLLSAPEDSPVTMVREGETEITGSGFEADFRLNEIRFDKGVRGELQLED